MESDFNYSLSIKAKSDIRYFASEFGRHVLTCLMVNFFPITNKNGNKKKDKNNDIIRENISNLIRIFGTYIVYCFMEAARPINDDDKMVSLLSSNMASSIWDRHALISKYLGNIFPIDTMYDYFLSIIKYLFDKNDRKEQEFISLSPDSNKFVKELDTIYPSRNGNNNNNMHHISAVGIVEAFQTLRIKQLTAVTKQRDSFEHRLLKDKPFYELDQATVQSLDNELMKMIDTKTYRLLSSKRKIMASDSRLKKWDLINLIGDPIKFKW